VKVRTRHAGADAVGPAFPDRAAVFREQLDLVGRTLRRQGVSRADVDDLAQEVLVVVWRRWADYDPARPLRHWVAGIARRVGRSHLRRPRREEPRSEVDVEDGRLGGEEQLHLARLRARLMAALASLPERHRTAIMLHDLQGLRAQRMAEVMGVPIMTAYTRLRRARRGLAERLAALA
jgi:RNA polymerase sigma-70 factor, ECF subfamily